MHCVQTALPGLDHCGLQICSTNKLEMLGLVSAHKNLYVMVRIARSPYFEQ